VVSGFSPDDTMRLVLNTCDVRSWEAGDIPSLVAQANNRKIWRNLRDYFPHPYTAADGRRFLKNVRASTPETMFAIAVERQAVGGIGYVLQRDVERVSAEIGYWLGESYWGRGIATEAVKAVTAHAIREHELTRMYARVASWNTASSRVLEKAGYKLEATLHRSAIKNGVIIDQLQYAFIVPGRNAGPNPEPGTDPPPRGSRG
jgi:RimJ/RimL family protein N-acetyltransferase